MKYLLLLLLPIIFKAQTFTGIYSFKINSAVPSISNMQVKASENHIWETMVEKVYITDSDYEKKENDRGVVVGNMYDNYKTVDTKNKPEFFKSIDRNELFSRNFYVVKECYIKEELPSFNWTMAGETEYNGKKYNVAKSEFRGLNWIVYFDPSYQFNISPWKFNGLPGLVVFAKSSDGQYTYELQEYKLSPEKTNLKNPFENQQFISWEDYKNNYREYLKKLLKRMDADDEDGNRGSIKIDNTMEDLGFKEISNS